MEGRPNQAKRNFLKIAALMAGGAALAACKEVTTQEGILRPDKNKMLEMEQSYEGKEAVLFGNRDYEVVQQPKGEVSWVSSEEGKMTHFRLPDYYGVTAIMAHSTSRGGKEIVSLVAGDILAFKKADNSWGHFKVDKFHRYRADVGGSPQSTLDMLKEGELGPADTTPGVEIAVENMSAGETFKKEYTSSGTMVLQTCLFNPDNPSDASWGRLIIRAEPMPGGDSKIQKEAARTTPPNNVETVFNWPLARQDHKA